MKQARAAAVIVAVLAVVGGVEYALDDGSKYEVRESDLECTYQPPGLRPVPCLRDGGYILKNSDYLDAGCLARVCPRYAEILNGGKSQFFVKPAEVQAKGVAKVAPVDAVPIAEESATELAKP